MLIDMRVKNFVIRAMQIHIVLTVKIPVIST